MNLQTLHSPNYNSYPIIFKSCTRYFNPFLVTDTFPSSFSNSDFKYGFYCFRKRVSISLIVRKKKTGLIGIRCDGSSDEDDGFYMRRAVELAKKAIGCTSPNPMVGCVIVKNGEVVGEGFHPKAGQPHAEVFALRNAGELAESATAYVSLEPCNHFGRTPPCTEALIRAKVKRVVVGMVDPNPIVASKGVYRLGDSGIDVTVGVEEELCKNLNEAYIHRMLTGKPFVSLRYSLSVNGRILDQVGLGAKESGGYYSQLLQEYDGVILSSSSLTENFTFPASQEPQAKQPLQIIVAGTPESNVLVPPTTDAATQVIIFADKDIVVKPETSQQGIEVVVLDKINLNAILEYCGHRGLCSILVDFNREFKELEELVKEGLEQGLVQRVVMEMLPAWDGRKESGIQTLKNLEGEVLKLRKLQSRISKESVLVEGYFDRVGHPTWA